MANNDITYTLNLDTTKMEQALINTNKEIIELNKSKKELSASNKQLEKENKALAKAGKTNSEVYKNNTKLIDANNAKLVMNAEQTKVLKKEYNATSKAIQNTNLARDKEGKSLKALKAQLSLVTAEIDNMSAEELVSTKRGQEMIKQQEKLTISLSNAEKAGGNFRRSVGDYNTEMGKTTKTFSLFGKAGNKLGSGLKSVGSTIKGSVTNAFKSFGAALKANPIFFVIGIITGAIAIMKKAMAPFQPFLDWISDKIAYLSGLVDGVVEAFKSLGSISLGEARAQIEATAKSQEALNKALREYNDQQLLNDATTAEVTAKMRKLEGVYKDQGKSIEERKLAFEKYYKMKKEQAMDDFNNEKTYFKAYLLNLNTKHQKLLEEQGFYITNATEAKKARELGIITEEEYKETQKEIIKFTELAGKVADEAAKKSQEANRLRKQGITELLGLEKAELEYYKVTHQSKLEDAEVLTQELIDEEEKRLNNIKKREIEAVRASAKVQLNEYKENANKTKEIKLKLQADLIKLNEKYNKQIKNNQKKLDDETKKALEELKKAKAKTLEAIEVLQQNSALKLLKGTEGYYSKMKEYENSNYESKVATAKKTIKDEELLKLELQKLELEHIDALKIIDSDYQVYKDELGTQEAQKQEEKRLAELEAEKTLADKKKAIKDKELENLNNGLNAGLEAISIYQDAVKAEQDKELAYTEKLYNSKKRALDEQLKDGLISQEEYDKKLLDAQIKKAKKENEINRKAFEAEKETNILKAVMATALGVANSLSAGMPWGAVLAALSAAAGAVQIATISNQQFVPAEIPTAAGGGLLRGAYHAGGGVMLGGIEAEGDEFVINRAATAKNLPLLGAINATGNTNGDVNNTTPLIDYDLLASKLNNKKVYVVSHEITDTQATDALVSERSSF